MYILTLSSMVGMAVGLPWLPTWFHSLTLESQYSNTGLNNPQNKIIMNNNNNDSGAQGVAKGVTSTVSFSFAPLFPSIALPTYPSIHPSIHSSIHPVRPPTHPSTDDSLTSFPHLARQPRRRRDQNRRRHHRHRGPRRRRDDQQYDGH